MRYRLTALLLLVSLTFCACSGTPAPEKALGKMLDQLIVGKISQAEKHTAQGTLHINGWNSGAKKMYKTLFSSMSYSISGSSVSDDYAEVWVTVTILDLESIIADASLEVLGLSLGGVFGDNKKLYASVTEHMQAADATYTTLSSTAYMVKEAGKWKVDMDLSDQFADAIAGGVGELIGY